MMWNNSWNWSYPPYNAMGNFFGAWFGFFLLPILAWTIVWKGWALWKAAKNDSKPWFIVLLVVNTLGILDLLYIFVFGKKSPRKK